MAAAAGALVQAFTGAGIVGLDYSPASLTVLDQVIDREWPPGQKPATETIGMMGAYLGEVLVRNLGARWTDQTPTGEPGLKVGDGIAFPLSKVVKRVDIGNTHSLSHFYSELASYLVQGPTRTSSWTPREPPAGQPKTSTDLPRQPGFMDRFRRKPK